MTCSTCGALMGTLDTTCGSCGVPILTTTMPSPPATGDVARTDGNGERLGPPPPVLTIEPAPTSERVIEPLVEPAKTRRSGWSRSSTILAAVLVIALAAGVGVAVSRAQVAGRLSTTEAALRDVRGQLDASTANVDRLESEIGRAADQQDAVETQRDDARTSLRACQELFRASAEIFAGGRPSPADLARLQSQLVACFEGRVPRSIFG